MRVLEFIYKLRDDFRGGADRIIRSLRDLYRNEENATRGAARLQQMLSRIHSPASAAAGGLRGLGNALGATAIGAAAFVGIGAGAALAVKGIIDAAGYKEQQLIAFNSILKDTKVAANVYANAVAFAGRTPFNTQEIIEATKSMLSYGFATKDLEGVLTSAGNLAAGMGKPLEQATLAFAALKGGDFGQAFGVGQGFNQLGITREKLEGAGLKFDKSGSYKGSVELAMAAVQQIIAKDFGDGMEKQSKSIFGLTSTLLSRPFELFSNLFDTEIADDATQPIRTFLQTLVDLSDFAKPPGSQIQTAFKAGMGGILASIFTPLNKLLENGGGERIVKQFFNGINNGVAWLRTEGPKIWTTAREIFGGIISAVKAIAPIVQSLAPLTPAIIAFFVAIQTIMSIGSLITTITALGGVLPILSGALGVFGGPWGIAIALIVAGVTLIIANWGKIRPVIQPILNWFGTAIKNTADWFVGAWRNVSGFFVGLWGQVKNTFDGAINFLAQFPFTPIGAVAFLIKNFSRLPQFFLGIWTRVRGAFSAAINFLARFPATPIGALAWLIQNFNRLPQFFTGLWTRVRGIFNGAINFLARFPATPIGALAWLIQNWNRLPFFFNTIWTRVRTYFAGAAAWFSSLPAQFAAFGANMIQGLIGGITSRLAAVKDAIVGAANSAVGWFKNALGIASPSKVFAGLGVQLPAGLERGIRGGQEHVGNAIKALATSAAITASVVLQPTILASQNTIPKFVNSSVGKSSPIKPLVQTEFQKPQFAALPNNTNLEIDKPTARSTTQLLEVSKFGQSSKQSAVINLNVSITGGAIISKESAMQVADINVEQLRAALEQMGFEVG